MKFIEKDESAPAVVEYEEEFSFLPSFERGRREA